MMKHIRIYSTALIVLLAGQRLVAQNKPDDFFHPSSNGVTIPAAPTYSVNPYLPTFNYVRTWVPRRPFNTLPNTWTQGVDMSTIYKNGFGSPLQAISHGNLKDPDVIKLNNLAPSDTQYNYLPYAEMNKSTMFRMNGYGEQDNFNAAKYTDEWGVHFSKSIKSVSNGATYLHRYSAGASFAGADRGDVVYTTINDATLTADQVYMWRMGDVSGRPEATGFYSSDQLTITHDKMDEHQSHIRTYRDKDGRVVCKKLNNGMLTYYVYDPLGRIAWIIPPKAAPFGVTIPYLLNSGIADSLCYSYKYDKYGQVIEKHVPDRIGLEKTVYDRYHRPVLYQNALLAQQNKWQFTVYDIKDRVSFTGVFTDPDANTRAFWQDRVLETSGWTGPTSYQPIADYLRNGMQNIAFIPSSVTNCQINSYNYYDDYDDVPQSGIPGRFKSYPQQYIAQVETIFPELSEHTEDKLVYSRTRVLDPVNNNKWINTLYYYDFEGRLIQTQTLNPWNSNNDWDINSFQYDFSGNVVLEIDEHYSWTGTNKPATTVYTNYKYHAETGKLDEVLQKIDSSAWETLASYTYDYLQRVHQKTLGKVEVQTYSYNIRGQLTGINGAYVFDTLQDDRVTFGEMVCYDYGFDEKRYDGKITGYLYRGSGRLSLPRAYGYLYDNFGRLTMGDFYEMRDPNSPPPISSPPNWYGWHKDVDFTASDIHYDANGNLLSMQQMGNALSGPVVMDILYYTYYPNSNRLKFVEDAVGTNYNLHDFLDGNTDGADYDYDANGNLKQDLNKGITNIAYNYMDLPTSIQTTTGSITKIYDAAGALLQKITTENSVSDTERYWGPFVYRNDSMLYLLHQEGRSRYIAAQHDFQNDFFVKDHLGNVRTVVQSEVSWAMPASHEAGWEVAMSTVEDNIFDPITPIRDNKPQGGIGDVESGRLDGQNPAERIGASLLLHGMAGDKLEVGGWGYYESEGPFNTYTMPEYMLESLVDVMTGGSGEGSEGGPVTTTINQLLTGPNYDAYDLLKQNSTDPAYPRTYLNMLVFDGSFQLHAEESQVIQLRGSANNWTLMAPNDIITMPANGWLLTYYSNESDVLTWIDNVYVKHYKGKLLEETHYYPHGLTIDAGTQNIDPQNDYLHQSKKLERAMGIDLYDFHARQYDPQIGRFWGVDLADQFPSGYTGMGNDPANMVDPTGMVATSTGGGGGVGGGGSHNVIETGSMGYTGSQFNNIADQEYGLSLLDHYYYQENESGAGSGETNSFENTSEGEGEGGGNSKSPKENISAGYSVAEAKKMGALKDNSGRYYIWVQDDPNDLTTLHKNYLMMQNSNEGGASSGIMSATLTIAAATSEVPPVAGVVLGVGAVAAGAYAIYQETQRTYVTYTLTNATGQIYVGRASGFGTPHQVMMNRFYGHHMRYFGYGNPLLDEHDVGYPLGYYSIRGREQMLIDYYGGINSPRVGNRINGIWEYSPRKFLFMNAAYNKFGPVIK